MIDWGNPGFLRTYALAFAASTFLTIIVWLISVAKRALRGGDPVRALAESVGYLLMSVLASSFAPLVIAELTDLVDQISGVMLHPVFGDLKQFLQKVTGAQVALAATPSGVGVDIALGVIILLCTLLVWLELVVRNALILLGLVMGPTVFAGLVDQDMWKHTRRWFGVMGGIIASKYVTFTVLALGTGILAGTNYSNQSFPEALGTLLTATAVLALGMFVPMVIARFLPLVGDDLHAAFQSRQALQDKGKQAAGSASRMAGMAKRGGGSLSDLRGRMNSDGDAPSSDGQGDDGPDDTTRALTAGGSPQTASPPAPSPSPGGPPAPTPQAGGGVAPPPGAGSPSWVNWAAPARSGSSAPDGAPPASGGGSQNSSAPFSVPRPVAPPPPPQPDPLPQPDASL
jgi:hypothetical protein